MQSAADESGPVAAFRAALASGTPAFLWGGPGVGTFAALGEGGAGLRVGALGFAGGGSLWRPAKVVAWGDAFAPGHAADGAAGALNVPASDGDRPPGAGRVESVERAERTDDAPSEAWTQAVERATTAVRAGALRKVVLARTVSRTAPAGTSFDPAATWVALRAAHPCAFVFAVARGGAAFVGASPERLASTSGGRLSTEALAGTAPRSTAPAVLLESAKDREEHALVVDEIRAGLANLVRPGSLVAPDSPRLRALPHLWHLHTPITAHLRPGATLLDVVLALHPTPALCGVPRAAAAAFLKANEGFDRGLYAGPVGFVCDTGDGTFAVGIRSAALCGAEATLYAGAGLVGASEPDAEWRETGLKLRTMDELLRTC